MTASSSRANKPDKNQPLFFLSVDVAIQRLLWAGVAVAVVTKGDPATGAGASVSAADGTRVRLPRGAIAVVAANDDDACVG